MWGCAAAVAPAQAMDVRIKIKYTSLLDLKFDQNLPSVIDDSAANLNGLKLGSC